MISSSHPMRMLPDVLRCVPKDRDTWITPNQFFRPNRRLVNLKQINTAFADLDTYKNSDLQKLEPEGLAVKALETCQDNKLPTPSLILYSGRGIQAKWVFDKPIPRQALPRWNAVQRYLTNALKELGADPNSIDGSRVLRLEKTINSKSGETVRVLWPETKEPAMWDFELFASEILPFSREELRAARATREARKIDRVTGLQYRFNQQTLNWARLEDIRRLAYLREWTQGNPDGSRDPFVYLGAVFASWVAKGNLLFWETEALAKEFAPLWTRSKLLSKVSSYFRMVDAGRRYRFTNQRLLEVLQVTPGEERQMKTIMSKDEARRRRQERREDKRRAAGAIERAEYEGKAMERRAKATDLRQKGFSFREIASQIGITRRHAIRLVEG